MIEQTSGGQTIGSPIRQLTRALSLLNHKSEEIDELKDRIAEGSAERQELASRIANLEDGRDDLAKQLEVQKQSCESKDAEINSLRTDNANVVDARDKLMVELRELQIAKDDSEKEALIFREQYGHASARNDELRSDCKNLSNRVLIAEKQVTDGLVLIRSTYEGHVKRLKDELEKAQTTLKILQERDRRTDDEVRRKAASVPELEAKIVQLQNSNADLKEDANTLVKDRNDLLVLNNTLMSDNETLRTQHGQLEEQGTKLSIQLARYAARERYMIKLLHDEPLGNSEVFDVDEEVFVCEWNIPDGGTCGAIFRTREVSVVIHRALQLYSSY